MSILDSPAHVLELVSRIEVPPNTAFAGEFPIISIVLATDDASVICDNLRVFTSDEWVMLSEIVERCVNAGNYPHAHTVWPYNSPQVSIDRWDTAAKPLHTLCKAARLEIIDTALLHQATFPFIETYDFPMDEGTVILPNSRENNAGLSPLPPNEGSLLPLLMPTLAIGSIFMLAKNKISEESI